MESGLISVGPLYDLIRSNPDPKGLLLGSPMRRRYGSVAKIICAAIAQAQGFYLWGRYEANGLWRNTYIGKAGFGKTAHLRGRILEELKDERACIWRAFVSERMLREAGKRNHPTMWHVYKQHMARALKKTGTTHIAWVADPNLPKSAVQNIESDLIEILNPAANVLRPVPPVSLQKHTKEIIAALRAQIHTYRRP
ncbi:MAG: hypothetical protein FJW35_18045 [Acidobacteria bacterium]|nr:hypothetical protein [Acidobacteriota bacterium]